MRRVLCLMCGVMLLGATVPAAAAGGDLREAMKIAAVQAAQPPSAPTRELSPAFKWTGLGLLMASAANLAIALAADNSARDCHDFGCRNGHLQGAAVLGAAGVTVLAIGYARAPRAPAPAITVRGGGFAIQQRIRF